MRLTIIVEDGAVYKDGVSFSGLNLSGIPAGVRAVQWYGTIGEVEFDPISENGQLVTPPNQEITDLAPFQPALNAWQAAYDAANAPPPAPTQEQIIARFTTQIQARLDTFARTRNYDGILSACTYATDPNPKFAAEGQYCVNKRSETWAAAYTIIAQVQAGTRPMPSSIADIEPDLPVLQWPA